MFVKVYPKSQKVPHLAKIWTFENVRSRKPVCVKCGTYELDHLEEVCKKGLNCSNWADSKHCKICEKESEILKIKVILNITFPEARKLVEKPFIKLTFAKITKSPSNPNGNQIDTLIKMQKIKELINLMNYKNLIKTLKTTIPNIEKNLCQLTKQHPNNYYLKMKHKLQKVDPDQLHK